MTERTLRDRLHEIAYRDEAKTVTVRTDDLKAILALLDAHTAAQPAPDAVAGVVDALGNIAAMGYSDDPAVQANIARMAVEMARSARSAYFKGPSA